MAWLPMTCEGARPTGVYLAFAKDALPLGCGEEGKLSLHGYQAPDTSLAESLADLSSKLSSEEKKGMDR